MNKRTVLLLSSMLILATTGVSYAEGIDQASIPKQEEVTPPVNVSVIEYHPELYKTPNLTHAIASYKNNNFTGAAQELLSYLDKKPEDAKAYYYLAATLANLGDSDAAVEAYEKVITLSKSEELTAFAAKGKDCLTGGPLCAETTVVDEELDELDEFVQAPYGDGFSEQVREQMKERKLKQIQNNINRKPELSPDEVQEIKDFDKENSSEVLTDNKIAMADGPVSNDDIVSAINTLRQAGMTVSIQPTAATSYQNPQMAEMSMMLGTNRNNNDPMSQMLPYMMQAGTKESAENLNPQVIQAMMMNSMMSNMDFNTSDNK